MKGATVAKLGVRVMLGIPTTAAARMSPLWIDAMAGLQMPLGSSFGRNWTVDQPIAQARQSLAEAAVAGGADYLVFLGDDVLPPSNMIMMMLDKIGREFPVGDGRMARASMITGVYWTKGYPSEPYLWNLPLMSGSYQAWQVGEFFPIDLAGCDCLMVETAMLKALPRPWFSTEWVCEPGQSVSPIATEDFYFYTLARRHGFRLFADTGIQCWHEDRGTGQCYMLTTDMRQAGGVPEGGDDVLLVAELGSGTDSPAWGPNCTVVRFDARPDVKPDVRCDLRHIPEAQFGRYDVVHARHILEHFGRREAAGLVAHWTRLLKPGGQFVVRVPNIAFAMKRIMASLEPDGAAPDTYDWSQLYGGQHYDLDFHKSGYTARSLRGLLTLTPGLTEIEVIEEQDGLNLKATARLRAAPEPAAIADWWDEIAVREALPAGATKASED